MSPYTNSPMTELDKQNLIRKAALRRREIEEERKKSAALEKLKPPAPLPHGAEDASYYERPEIAASEALARKKAAQRNLRAPVAPSLPAPRATTTAVVAKRSHMEDRLSRIDSIFPGVTKEHYGLRDIRAKRRAVGQLSRKYEPRSHRYFDPRTGDVVQDPMALLESLNKQAQAKAMARLNVIEGEEDAAAGQRALEDVYGLAAGSLTDVPEGRLGIVARDLYGMDESDRLQEEQRARERMFLGKVRKMFPGVDIPSPDEFADLGERMGMNLMGMAREKREEQEKEARAVKTRGILESVKDMSDEEAQSVIIGEMAGRYSGAQALGQSLDLIEQRQRQKQTEQIEQRKTITSVLSDQVKQAHSRGVAAKKWSNDFALTTMRGMEAVVGVAPKVSSGGEFAALEVQGAGAVGDHLAQKHIKLSQAMNRALLSAEMYGSPVTSRDVYYTMAQAIMEVQGKYQAKDAPPDPEFDKYRAAIDKAEREGDPDATIEGVGKSSPDVSWMTVPSDTGEGVDPIKTVNRLMEELPSQASGIWTDIVLNDLSRTLTARLIEFSQGHIRSHREALDMAQEEAAQYGIMTPRMEF